MEVEAAPDDWQNIKDTASYLSTPLNAKSAVIKPNVLQGGKKYRLRLFAWIPSAKSRGFSEEMREANKPPDVGSCEISPISGFTMTTEFSVACKGWYDDDSPLSYALLAEKLDGTHSKIRSWIGKESVVHSSDEVIRQEKIKLPKGPDPDNRLKLIVEVSDTEGAISTFSLYAQVGHPQMSHPLPRKCLQGAVSATPLFLFTSWNAIN